METSGEFLPVAKEFSQVVLASGLGSFGSFGCFAGGLFC